jgi:hypothetical protein
MTLNEIQAALADAQGRAEEIARNAPVSADVQALAYAIAEIGRATGELAKKVKVRG